MSDADTIFALSSAPGVAGVAVVRVSGGRVGAVVDALGLRVRRQDQPLTPPSPQGRGGDVAPTVPLAPPLPWGEGRGEGLLDTQTYRPGLEPRHAHLVKIKDPHSRDLIDSGLALLFPQPASFTGESVLELHVHGGRAVAAALLAALSKLPGLRLAEPGEFTRRAFQNGKLDLTGAEGLAALLAAETEAQRRSALRVAGGELRNLYEGWRSRLIEAMALMEAAIDFSDEADVAANAVAQARGRVVELQAHITAHLNDNRRGEILRDGLRVVLAGPPNAGKSSLLNALARRDVAIVSPEPGTTRDVIEARLDLGGFPVIVSDTAGIRPDPGGAIEQEGIRRTFASSQEADIVLWLIDSTDPVPNPPAELASVGQLLLRVRSKADLVASGLSAGPPAISTTTGAGIDGLLALLTAHARDRIGDGGSAAIITSRQRALLTETSRSLTAYVTGSPEATELRAEDLRQAAQSLGRLTGRVDVEDVLDRVFSAFCIGK